MSAETFDICKDIFVSYLWFWGWYPLKDGLAIEVPLENHTVLLWVVETIDAVEDDMRQSRVLHHGWYLDLLQDHWSCSCKIIITQWFECHMNKFSERIFNCLLKVAISLPFPHISLLALLVSFHIFKVSSLNYQTNVQEKTHFIKCSV